MLANGGSCFGRKIEKENREDEEREKGELPGGQPGREATVVPR